MFRPGDQLKERRNSGQIRGQAGKVRRSQQRTFSSKLRQKSMYHKLDLKLDSAVDNPLKVLAPAQKPRSLTVGASPRSVLRSSMSVAANGHASYTSVEGSSALSRPTTRGLTRGPRPDMEATVAQDASPTAGASSTQEAAVDLRRKRRKSSKSRGRRRSTYGRKSSRVMWGSNPLTGAKLPGRGKMATPHRGRAPKAKAEQKPQAPPMQFDGASQAALKQAWVLAWRELESQDTTWPTRFWRWVEGTGSTRQKAGAVPPARGRLQRMIRGIISLSLSYNLLASFLCICLFITVQGALIASLSFNAVPVELVAALLLVIAAGCSIAVEVFLAVMFTAWYRAASAKYQKRSTESTG